LEKDPLQKRGWTLQETQLSVRLLYCSRHELFWQCREGITRELDPTHYLIPADPLAPRRIFDVFVQYPANIFSRWYDLVERYSARKLSYGSDALPAMSGLAGELALYIQSRSRRRLATEEEVKRLKHICPPSPSLPTKQELDLGLNQTGTTHIHGANESMARILDLLEYATGRPRPGYEHMPVRTDPLLVHSFTGGLLDDCQGHSPEEIKRAWPVLSRVMVESGVLQALKTALQDEDPREDLWVQTMSHPATHLAFQRWHQMTHAYLQNGIDLTSRSAGPRQQTTSSGYVDMASGHDSHPENFNFINKLNSKLGWEQQELKSRKTSLLSLCLHYR
jgi:hypothetical protein